MAKRASTVYVCSSCGEEFVQWQGRCSSCGEWNSLREFNVPAATTRSARTGRSSAAAAAVAPTALAEIAQQPLTRASTGFSEADRVLGGGIVPGSVILLGGDPGIGKSTVLLQIVEHVARATGKPLLYVSGEESLSQIKLRADRLGVAAPSLRFLAATDVSLIEQTVEAAVANDAAPALLIIDSIQTMYDAQYPSTPGSIVQVRETAIRIQQLAKRLGVPVILVGHITKEGTVAGPRLLEHLVDVVLYLEGEAQRDLRVLRGVKNRFGSVNEVGLFAMHEEGLVEVPNPNELLLAERVVAPGTVLSAVLEGSRPLLIEVQALTVPSAFGYPRRTASGYDLNRLNLLLAVLQRRVGVTLASQDVFINVVGGLKVKDPALDAAVCLALASAKAGVALPEKLCVFGEVGLVGELRRVVRSEQRTKEVQQLGYTVPPATNSLRSLITRYIKAASAPDEE